MNFKDAILIENLYCEYCGQQHIYKNIWALKAHKTHLCLHCGAFFEGTRKAVSFPIVEQTYIDANVEDLFDEYCLEDITFYFKYKDIEIEILTNVDSNGDIIYTSRINKCILDNPSFFEIMEAYQQACEEIDNEVIYENL